MKLKNLRQRAFKLEIAVFQFSARTMETHERVVKYCTSNIKQVFKHFFFHLHLIYTSLSDIELENLW